MTAKDDGWHEGARVFVVETHNRREPLKLWATVTKVGKKWVSYRRDGELHTGRIYRFDAQTMQIDGGDYTSPGTVFLTEMDYENRTELGALWREFRSRIGYRPPDGMTPDALRRIMAECGLPPEQTGAKS